LPNHDNIDDDLVRQMACVAQTCTPNEPSRASEAAGLKEAMRGCDVPPRNEKFNDCMYVRIRSLEKEFRLFFVAVYVRCASWTGCAALGGLLMTENDWAV
jgi:hypothetical protein